MFSTLFGVVLGLVAGFSRGWLDRIIMFVTDLFLSFPFILGALAMAPIIVSHFAKPGQLGILSKVQLFALIGILVDLRLDGRCARLIRGQVLSLREREFVQAAQVMGVPTRRILFKELLPNLVAPIVVADVAGPPRRSSPPRPACRTSASASPAIPSLGPDHRRRPELLGRLPAVPLGPVLTICVAGPGAQPPRRLHPRRLRPQDSPVIGSPGEMQHPRKGWAMRFKSPLIAISAVGVLALSACGGSGSDNSGTADQTEQNENIGNTGNGQDASAKGPVTISGAKKGGIVTVLTLTGLHDDDRPERGLLRRHLVDPERSGHPVADAVQVRPHVQADDPGPRPGHRPGYATTTTTPSGRSRSARV